KCFMCVSGGYPLCVFRSFCSTGIRDLPDLPGTATVGAEIDPTAIVRPAWAGVVGAGTRDALDGPATGLDDIDMRVVSRLRIKGHMAAIRGPSGRPDIPSLKICQLARVFTIAAANPDFEVAGSVGRESDGRPIGRETGVIIDSTGWRDSP